MTNSSKLLIHAGINVSCRAELEVTKLMSFKLRFYCNKCNSYTNMYSLKHRENIYENSPLLVVKGALIKSIMRFIDHSYTHVIILPFSK